MATTHWRLATIVIMTGLLGACDDGGTGTGTGTGTGAGGGVTAPPATQPTGDPAPALSGDPAPAAKGSGGGGSTRPLGGTDFIGLQTPRSLVSNHDGYYVVLNVEPNPLPLNEVFSMDVRVASNRDRSTVLDLIEIDVDGRMPAHKHGMNREPTIEKNADGTFTVSNMLFHMPGDWEIYIDITRAGMTERAQVKLTLE